MKKTLFLLFSWTLLLFGALTFSSCGSDDDDNDSSAGGSGKYTQVFEKYAGSGKAVINGDDVYLSNVESAVTIYHFSGEKLVSATQILDYMTPSLAKLAYNQFKGYNYYDLKQDGRYVSYSFDDFDETMTKEQLCNSLNGQFQE